MTVVAYIHRRRTRRFPRRSNPSRETSNDVCFAPIRRYGGSGSLVGCGRTSCDTFSTVTQLSFVFAPSALEAVASSPPSPPSSHLTRSTPASHCELSDEGAGESLPADSESGEGGDAEPVLCVLSPHPMREAKVPTTGDGVRACTVVIECECAW